MNILILNENKRPVSSLQDESTRNLVTYLEKQGCKVTVINTAEAKIADCIGCFSCWIKTPGECIIKDDQIPFLKEFVNSDLCLFISPVRRGFITAELKKSIDRIIPVALPFFKSENGRMAHHSRYERDPELAFILDYETSIDRENEGLIKEWVNLCFSGRLANNDLFLKDINDFNAIKNLLDKRITRTKTTCS